MTTCLWDHCMTLEGLESIMGYFRVNYDAKLPEHRVVGYLISLWAYISSGGKLENAVDGFGESASAVLDTLIGLSVAAYAAFNIIDVSVNLSADGSATDRFKDYGTQGWLGAFIGLFQGMWVMTFLGYCVMIAIAPVKLALDLNANGEEMNTILYFHVLQAFAAYIGFSTIVDAKNELFAVFDNGALDPNYGEDISNNMALSWDLITHTFVALGYSVVTVAVALGPFLYAEFRLDVTQFPEWAQAYA